ncbi:dephospho-CoA kinase [Bacillus sp. SCS-151]|uniref:dephospho-CoA kinase n=1 Tax=Nanhaiella sioensis TaxID=3115293 RepID=UPI00397D099C
MTLIIGLTGGIASGKSTVAKMLEKLGFPIVDADIIAREVVTAGESAYKKIIATFGEKVTQPNGELDREKLGNIIFHDEEKRQQLNSIVHPAVRKKMFERMDEYMKQGLQVVILDIPLLFESKLTDMVDKTLLVYVDPDVQLHRLMQRNNYLKHEAEARINSQMPLKDKISLASAVLNNNGSILNTEEQLHKLLQNWSIQILPNQ